MLPIVAAASANTKGRTNTARKTFKSGGGLSDATFPSSAWRIRRTELPDWAALRLEGDRGRSSNKDLPLFLVSDGRDADGLAFAQGVLAIRGGLLVTASPDLLFLADDDGDGRADRREVLATGAISGHPVVDVRVIVYDGKHHSVDSKDIAFATAGRKAFLAAIRDARPQVLEPIVHIEISAADAAMGDITGDLSAKRGLVTGTSNGAAGQVVVRGQVPMSELSGYQSRLNALTSGQGRYSTLLSHYEAVPPAVQQQLTSQFRGHDDDQ
jgi:hypothetical protein